MPEFERRRNIEIEHELVPTALRNFRGMVADLIVAGSPTLSGTARFNKARDNAYNKARRVLTSPPEQRADVARAFGILRESDQDLAKDTLKALRSTGLLPEKDLRAFLGLPEKGRIFPKS